MLLIIVQDGKELHRNENWFGYFGKEQAWCFVGDKKYRMIQWTHNVTEHTMTAEVSEVKEHK